MKGREEALLRGEGSGPFEPCERTKTFSSVWDIFGGVRRGSQLLLDALLQHAPPERLLSILHFPASPLGAALSTPWSEELCPLENTDWSALR